MQYQAGDLLASGLPSRVNEAADKSAKETTGWRLKMLRHRGVREEDTLSTAAKAQWVKELLSAKKTQATKNTMRE